MEITREEWKELKDEIKQINTNVQKLMTADAVQESTRRYILEHRDILKGKGDEPGLVATVDRHERWIESANKIVWAFVLVFIGEFAVGVLFILRFGV